MTQAVIQAREVGMRFHTREGELAALEDFSLDVHKGEVVCLVGASGCGKSTFLNIVAGFLAPTAGQVLLEGQPISGVEPRCGMIFQNYALFPWMTVLDNVAFGPRVNGASKPERTERARHWIRVVGLKGFEQAYPGELSGGMQQRVALSRALANEPEVLLCDEPFAALDAMTRQILQQELLRVVAESRKTVLFITHSIDEALILSNRLVVMSARPGRVKAVYENDLPQPRTLDVQLTDRFLELKREVWDLVQEEVVGSMTALQRP
ncbi:MAG: ABC transporter ATP-binding protein [Pseudomonadota bacterium]|nr:ABC transporter ATP-binding protein [Pseudomonadota bacterium]